MRIAKAMLRRDDAAALQQQIAALKSEAAEACAEIERLEAERVLADNYEAASSLDERIKRQRWVLQHADAVLPELELRVAALRQVEQAAALARHKAAVAGFVPKLSAAVEAAAEVQVAAIKLREAAVAELGESVVAATIPHLGFNGILLPDLVAAWRREVERMFAPPAAAPPRAVAPPARPKAAAAKLVIAPPAPRPTRAPRRDPPPEDPGQVAIRMLRNGVDTGDGPSVIGDTLTMMAEQGRLLVLRGCADYADRKEQAKK